MVIFKPIFILLILASIIQAGTSSSWYTGQQKGWLWYKRSPLPKFIDETQTRKANKPKVTKEHTSHIYTKRLELLRKNFDEILAKAVLEPTLDNVQQMQQAQNTIMNRSTEFSKMWMVSSLLSTHNFRTSDQPNPQHRKVYQEQHERHLDQKIKDLAKSYGLFFVFKGDCPYCHEFAPIVKELMNLYGFEGKAIAADGTALSLFPDATRDNGTIAVINPEGIYPSLLLVNPQSREVIPLARGLVNLSQLRENFKVIIQFLEETPRGR